MVFDLTAEIKHLLVLIDTYTENGPTNKPLKKGMDVLASRLRTDHLLRIAVNKPYHHGTVEQFLNEKDILPVDEELQEDCEAVRVLYEIDDISNVPDVKMTLCYDRKNHLIQDVTIETLTHNVDEVRNRVLTEINDLTISEED